ncbi:hypothetical protein ACMGDM_05705 [Sphingomonas sp. DT-51]|uniref:hypothetical protein n=1 Tax=Sphingomonas sp. DT-51 TaxID=3396165 RepID=UPI003F1C5611
MQILATLSSTAYAISSSPALVPARQTGERKANDASAAPASATPTDKESFTDTGNRARQLLDAKYAEARKAGTRIKYDMSEQGVRADYSSFSDQELASIALNRNHQFTEDESGWARGEFNQRERVALEPFRDAVMHRFDRRGMVVAVNMLYNSATSEVREALRWDEAMMASGAEMLARDTKDFGPIDRQSVAQLVLGTRSSGRPLGIDFLNKGENFNFDWSRLFYTPSPFAKKDAAPTTSRPALPRSAEPRAAAGACPPRRFREVNGSL